VRIVSIMGREMPVRLAEIELLYRARVAAFRRVARGMLGDPEAARDAVQEAFAQAVRERSGFRREGSLEAWVWQIVLNAARAQRRASKAHAEDPLQDFDAPTNGARPQGDARVRAAVAALPERQRLILFLRYYADLDYATIAEALEISSGTVAATLNSAHASLRNLLEEAPR
jgi:RNA polymerase sigma factor (sigma-70 family)